MRGILRMDPDVIFIGEVRDGDTAQMALRAAMTGHQVYTTLHCNEALGALPRLIDLGLSPRILAGISAALSHSVLCASCAHCKLVRRATPDEMITLHCRTGSRVRRGQRMRTLRFYGPQGRTVMPGSFL